MRQALSWTLKAGAVWIALLAGTVAAGFAIAVPAAPGGDGPLSAGQAFLAVNLLSALVLAALAPRLRGTAAQRCLTMFALLYGAGTLLAHVEAWFFGSVLAIPEGLLESIALTDALRCAAGASAAAALWPAAPGGASTPSGLAWKLPAVALLYILVYFTAGFVIAWQSEAVRGFYGDGFAFDLGSLVLLQFARGAAWAALALLAVRAMSGPLFARGAALGAAFSVFMAAPLLYPTALMPWAVRQVHLIELGVSNFLFGLAAALILLAAGRLRTEGRGNPVAASGSLS
jgi:hypothetical protein